MQSIATATSGEQEQNGESTLLLVLPELPSTLLMEHVMPFLDRITWNRFATCNKETYQASQLLHKCGPPPPWPTILHLERDSIFALAFSPDGTTLAAGCDYGKKTHIWDLKRGHVHELGEQASVYSIAFNHDGSLIAVGLGDCTIRIWNMTPVVSSPNATPVCEPIVLAGHKWGVLSVAFTTFSSSSTTTATTATRQHNKEDSILASGDCKGTIIIWRLEHTMGGVVCTPLNRLKAHARGVTSVAFSPSSSRSTDHPQKGVLLSGSYDGCVSLWNLDDDTQTIIKGHGSYIMSVLWSNDGTRVVSASSNGSIKVWSVTDDDDYTCVLVLLGHGKAVLSISLSADGTTLASGSEDETIRLWNMSTGTCERVIRDDDDDRQPGNSKSKGTKRFLTFTPQGKNNNNNINNSYTLCSVVGHQTARFWNINKIS
jgi:WD40 repeat protein